MGSIQNLQEMWQVGFSLTAPFVCTPAITILQLRRLGFTWVQEAKQKVTQIQKLLRSGLVMGCAYSGISPKEYSKYFMAQHFLFRN